MAESRRLWAVLLAGVLTLTGCAATEPAVTAPAGVTPAASAPAVESAPPPSAGEMSDSAPGEYLDYVDGIVEETAGGKVLFFHASWCPQCRKLDTELREQGAPDGYTVFKVDYDARADLRQRYGVTLQTTVVFVDDAGAPISSAVLYDDPSVASLLAAAP